MCPRRAPPRASARPAALDWSGEGLHRGIVQCYRGLWRDAATARRLIPGRAERGRAETLGRLAERVEVHHASREGALAAMSARECAAREEGVACDARPLARELGEGGARLMLMSTVTILHTLPMTVNEVACNRRVIGHDA